MAQTIEITTIAIVFWLVRFYFIFLHILYNKDMCKKKWGYNPLYKNSIGTLRDLNHRYEHHMQKSARTDNLAYMDKCAITWPRKKNICVLQQKHKVN